MGHFATIQRFSFAMSVINNQLVIVGGVKVVMSRFLVCGKLIMGLGSGKLFQE